MKENVSPMHQKIKGNLIFKVIIDRYIALLESSSLEINDIEIKGYDTIFQKRNH